MTALVELVVAIVSALVELMIHLLGFVFSTSFLATQSSGLKRAIYVVAALSALHLLLGLTLPILTEFNSYLLSPIFRWQVMLVTAVILFFSIVTIFAIDVVAVNRVVQASGTRPPKEARADSPVSLAIFLATALILSGLSIWVSQTDRRTTRQQLCDIAAGRISETWRARGESLLALSERYLKKDASGFNPCAAKPE